MANTDSMVVLPDGLTFGQIQWTVAELLPDSAGDLDANPDIQGVNGTVTIKASPSDPLLVQQGSVHMTVFPGPYTFAVTDGVMADAQGNHQINIPSTDCAIFNPHDFTYSANFNLGEGRKRGSFSFSLPANTVVDFTDIAPTPDNNGVLYARGAQGDPGPQGPQGDPGGATDDSVSGLINDTTTLSSAAARAAAVGSISTVASINIQGAWDFNQLPTVGGVPLGTDGGGGGGGTVVDATASVKGILQLAGDLSGTATAPTVPGLATKAALVHTHIAGNITDATTVGKAVLTAVDAPGARAAIGAGTSTLALGTTSTTALAGNYTPPDASSGTKGILRLAGDFAGTATSPTVPALATKAALVHTHGEADLTASGVKDATTFLRGDNVWAVPPGSVTSVMTASTLPASVFMFVIKSGGVWGPRPTTRTDLIVIWIGTDPDPAQVTSGTGGMYPNDVRWVM